MIKRVKESNFWKATIIRAVRTMAQTAIATIGTAFVLSDVQWGVVLSASVLAGILSILTSIATGLPEVDTESGK
jgi:ABC-type protease/lipase transport system fused ATPase/permease subunit